MTNGIAGRGASALRDRSRFWAWTILAIFLGLQAAIAFADLFGEAAAATWNDRRWAMSASGPERIEAAVAPWVEMYRAVEEHVPKESLVAFLVKLDPLSFDRFHRMAVLGYPRRSVAVTQPLKADELRNAASYSTTLDHPFFVIDVQSGFALPAGLSLVANGRGYTLWRFR